MPKLLNIAIPTYNRKEPLQYALDKFISQIQNKYEQFVDIFISDDCSTDGTEQALKIYTETHDYIKYRKYDKNIGLEKNLLESTRWCDGKYLWIFGDDDFLDSDTAIKKILDLLIQDEYQFIILNRTRKSFDLKENLTSNWMEVDLTRNLEYPSLKSFCNQWGIISIIGFISVNIFLRKKFHEVNSKKYFGIMYPQLGTMLEAFHDSKCLLITQPLVCHRTQTLDEKKRALGDKRTEKLFMSDYDQRDALYFSFRLINFLYELVKCNAFSFKDFDGMKEFVFANTYLKDFILKNIELYQKTNKSIQRKVLIGAIRFFNEMNLNQEQKIKFEIILSELRDNIKMETNKLEISVITPSYNQAEFLRDCLQSVERQTRKPLEHLVYDPGSSDGSVDIAQEFNHVELILGKDKGQSDAINKGLKRVRGDIVAWINSDDYYFDDTVFDTVLQRFDEPDQPDIIYGKGIYVDEQKKYLRDVYINKSPETLSWRFQQEDGILQPALFFRRDILDTVGYLTENLHFCMDYEFWIRCVQKGLKFAYIDKDISVARYHINNKTYGLRDKSYHEVMEMLHQRFGYVNHVWLRRYAEYLSEGLDGVLKHGGNVKIEESGRTDQYYHELLKAYNTNFETIKLLNSKSSEKGYGDTLREMKRLNIKVSTPCNDVPLDSGYLKNKVCYTVGEKRWAFDVNWKNKQIEKTHRFLDSEIRNRDKDVCIIVGNGPSLKKVNFKLFEGQDIIVSNNAFLNDDLMKYAKYYTVVNYLVAEQGYFNINLIKGVKKIIPYWLGYCINADDKSFFIDAVGYPEFSTNIYKNVSWRHTVSFYNMHIAFGLGYKKVILVGFDHSYKQSDRVTEGDIIHNDDDDENHFCAEYFKGKKWQAADVNKMEEMYILAKEAYEKNNREIVNCSIGGCLELFRRGDLKTELKKSTNNVIMKGSPSRYDNSAAETHGKVISGPFNRNQKMHIDESDIVYKLIRGIKHGKVMIDVGAHHGHALMPYAKDGWTIHAFEPDPKNREILKNRTVSYNNIHINKNAVSDEDRKEQCFFQSEESTGISSLLQFNTSHKEICKVNTISLNNYCALKGIDSVDILKIDTEGNDLNVLYGFPWETIKPKIIVSEFEDLKTVKIGYEFHDMAKFLKNKGYDLYISEWHPIIKYGIQHDWCQLIKYPCELISPRSWGNIIAIDKKIKDPTLDSEIKSTIESYLKKQNTIKRSLYRYLGIFKSQKDRLSMKISNKKNTYYIKIADYLLANFGNLSHALRFVVRSLRFMNERISQFKAALLAIVAFLIISLLFGGGYRFALVGLTSFILLSAISIAVLTYGAWILYRGKINSDAELNKLKNILAANASKLEVAVKDREELTNKLEAMGVSVEHHFQTVKDDIQGLAENETKISTSITAVEEKITKSIGYKIKSLNDELIYYTKGTHQFFNRYVEQNFVQKLEKNMNGNLSEVNINQNNINYLGTYINNIEKRCKGRFAGNIEDIILRNIFISNIQKEKIKILEIGSLFGIQLSIFYNTCRGHFKDMKLYAIDPLDGYYGTKNLDILTNEPISELTFFHNMRVSDVAMDDISLIKELSSSDTALKRAGERNYDVLIIDGDHSYEGVKYDFENYAGFVAKDGLVIFDDYASKEWPDVTQYVDAVVKASNDIDFVYSDYRTAIFKKK